MKKITYTKKDIIRRLSYKLNLDYDESKIIFDNVLFTINDLLVSSEKNVRIELRNFGIFNVVQTKERTNARNPKTGEGVIIPARKKILFKAGKKLNDNLNTKVEKN